MWLQTSHSCIFKMVAVVLTNRISRAIEQSPFTPHTAHIVKQDGTSALSEECKADSSGTCFMIKMEWAFKLGEIIIWLGKGCRRAFLLNCFLELGRASVFLSNTSPYVYTSGRPLYQALDWSHNYVPSRSYFDTLISRGWGCS